MKAKVIIETEFCSETKQLIIISKTVVDDKIMGEQSRVIFKKEAEKNDFDFEEVYDIITELAFAPLAQFGDAFGS